MQITLCDICKCKMEGNFHLINFTSSGLKLPTFPSGEEICIICKGEIEVFISELKNKHRSETINNIREVSNDK